MFNNMGRGHRFGNESLDVLNKGCLDFYDGIACSRIGVLVVISIITFQLVCWKIIKYHAYKHLQMHHYIIFYISGIQCITCALSFAFGIRYPQLDFIINFFKLFQFILICHLYWSMAARYQHRDDVVQHVVNPALCLYTLYCTTVVLMGMVDISSTWTECFRPYWLMLSSADFITVQLFAIVALYLIHSGKHSAISILTLPANNLQTRDVWLITAVYEVSAVVSVIFDTVMSFMGKEESGCSGIYNHVQLYYSILMISVVILKFFLPTWTLLCIFQPFRVKSRPSEVAFTPYYDGAFLPCDHYSGLTFAYLSTLPTVVDSHVFGGHVDFSCTDSSPDTSPTIGYYRPGIDDDLCNTYEKQLTNNYHSNEILENQCSMEHCCQKLEKHLESDIDNDSPKLDYVYKNLTTINEEGGNFFENPHE